MNYEKNPYHTNGHQSLDTPSCVINQDNQLILELTCALNPPSFDLLISQIDKTLQENPQINSAQLLLNPDSPTPQGFRTFVLLTRALTEKNIDFNATASREIAELLSLVGMDHTLHLISSEE